MSEKLGYLYWQAGTLETCECWEVDNGHGSAFVHSVPFWECTCAVFRHNGECQHIDTIKAIIRQTPEFPTYTGSDGREHGEY